MEVIKKTYWDHLMLAVAMTLTIALIVDYTVEESGLNFICAMYFVLILCLLILAALKLVAKQPKFELLAGRELNKITLGLKCKTIILKPTIRIKDIHIKGYHKGKGLIFQYENIVNRDVKISRKGRKIKLYEIEEKIEEISQIKGELIYTHIVGTKKNPIESDYIHQLELYPKMIELNRNESTTHQIIPFSE